MVEKKKVLVKKATVQKTKRKIPVTKKVIKKKPIVKKVVKKKVIKKKKKPINKGGRPTTYKVRFITLAEKYLKESIDKLELLIDQEINISKGKIGNLYKETKVTRIGRLNIKLPSIEGLAKYINVSRSTIYLWRDNYPLFSDILERILEEQAERLINMGLSGSYNGTITKLLLAKHGYVEKQEVENKTLNINIDAEDSGEFKELLKANDLI